MKRLDAKKELTFISNESNNDNVQAFESILPHFCLENKTHERVMKIIKDGERNAIDEFLELNNQSRAWYEIDDPKNADNLFNEYRKLLEKSYNDIKSWEVRLTLKNLYQSKESFLSGTFDNNGQKTKLFKYLLKNKALTSENVDYINSRRTQQAKTMLCISRNPIDFLYCSTNQSFGSCMSLDSDYSSAYYMSLGGLVSDTSRFIVMVVNGKFKRHTLDGNEFKHLSIQARSWGYANTEKGEIFIDREYPNDNYGIRDLLKDKYNVIRSGFESDPFFCPLCLELNSDERYLPYLDHIEIEDAEDSVDGERMCQYTTNGCDNSGQFSFDIHGGFEAVCQNGLDGSNGYTCNDCGERVDEDDAHNHDGAIYCESCFHDSFVYCNVCGETHPNGDTTYIYDDGDYCNDCLTKNFSQCEGCGEWIDNDDAYVSHDGEIYCETCFHENFTYCEKCETDVNNEEWDSEHNMCNDCVETNFTLCTECDTKVSNDEYNDDKGMCNDCVESIEEEERELGEDTKEAEK